LRVYEGDLLPGHYEDWVLREREHLRRACLDAAQEALGLLAEASAHVEAIALAHRALVIDPLHEPTWIGLMRAHADAGQPREALRAFAELEATLRRDLG